MGEEERRTRTPEVEFRVVGRLKLKCPACGKRIKAVGLADPQRDAHGVVRVLTQIGVPK